ncbi:MAG TPA: NrfD/PsrC family molybdoenzyme membrane anchor subunit [Euzebyales bacterium]|nr:NrfD/PsrC family molybdoenzyme membrane anchor subunit [Euzebyales bacterium]
MSPTHETADGTAGQPGARPVEGGGASASRSRLVRGGRGAVVPAAEVRTYYDKPVIKEPVWTWEIPWYFFTGGMSGASAVLAGVAQLTGHERLAKVARRVGMAALVPSPVLLVADLGRPERFHHMLRVFKPTSPMSVGSWTLLVFSGAQGTAWILDELGWLRPVRVAADAVAAALGTVMSTYTAVLFSDTAVPVWHEARRELPFVFAAGAAASAAAGALPFAGDDDGPALRLAVGAGVAELVAVEVMRRRLGELGEPYERGDAGRFATAAKWLAAAGAATTALGRRSRLAKAVGAGLLLGAAVCERWAVYRAGFISARDPRYTVGPQRARADAMR